MKNKKFLVGALILSATLLGTGYAAWSQDSIVYTEATAGTFKITLTEMTQKHATSLNDDGSGAKEEPTPQKTFEQYKAERLADFTEQYNNRGRKWFYYNFEDWFYYTHCYTSFDTYVWTEWCNMQATNPDEPKDETKDETKKTVSKATSKLEVTATKDDKDGTIKLEKVFPGYSNTYTMVFINDGDVAAKLNSFSVDELEGTLDPSSNVLIKASLKKGETTKTLLETYTDLKTAPALITTAIQSLKVDERALYLEDDKITLVVDLKVNIEASNDIQAQSGSFKVKLGWGQYNANNTNDVEINADGKEVDPDGKVIEVK